MDNIAIIPARGGSKRIPRKNIKLFSGRPVIEYSIEAAAMSGLFSQVMVSTDSVEIAKVAEAAGAKVPFIRSEKTSDDFASIADVIEEVLKRYNETGLKFERLCLIFATAPFISAKRLKEGYELLNAKGYDSVFPVLPYSFPIQRAVKIENDKVAMLWPENMQKRSQDLPESYHDSGQFYWMKTDSFLKKKRLWTQNTGALVLPHLEAHDIDTEEDWRIAELKYSILNG